MKEEQGTWDPVNEYASMRKTINNTPSGFGTHRTQSWVPELGRARVGIMTFTLSNKALRCRCNLLVDRLGRVGGWAGCSRSSSWTSPSRHICLPSLLGSSVGGRPGRGRGFMWRRTRGCWKRPHMSFAGVEGMIREGERFDLLDLPCSFPYGGMENPRMVFLTPTVIKGVGSGAQVVTHELAHSWTENLITNKNNEHFWLNEVMIMRAIELYLSACFNGKSLFDNNDVAFAASDLPKGFTTYVERRIVKAVKEKRWLR